MIAAAVGVAAYTSHLFTAGEKHGVAYRGGPLEAF
jgi:hypothetical protein